MKATTRLLFALLFAPLLMATDCNHETDFGGGSTPPDKLSILTTNDGGLSWKLETSVTTYGDPVSMSFLSPSSYVIIVHKNNGVDHFLTSIDDGKTWHSNDSTFGEDIYSVSSSDQNSVLSTANGFYYTKDGGASWNPVSTSWKEAELSTRDQLNMSGYPIGYFVRDHKSALAKTTDGGRTWTTLKGPEAAITSSNSYLDVDYTFGGSTVLVAQTGGWISRTHDDGASWENMFVDERSFSINFINIEENGQTVNAFSATGKVFHSDNLGDDWATISNPTMEPNGIQDVSSNARGLFVVGKGGSCAFSPDHGITWSKVPLPPASGRDLYCIDFRDDLHGMIVGKY